MSKSEKDLKKYLAKVNPVLERLVVDLLIDQPEDFVTQNKNSFCHKKLNFPH
jgi:hypothetical protein